MNWSDLAVVIIIGLFGIIGLINGFILSIFKLASFFVSVFISVKFYPKVAEILMKSTLYTSIRDSIQKNLMLQQQALIPTAGVSAEQAAAETVVGRLKLPDFFKEAIIQKIPDPSSLIDVSGLMKILSEELAEVIIAIISLVLLFVLVRIALIFLRFIFQGIAKLPVFKQMDKAGGFALGAVEGLLMVYILTAVLMLFHSAPWSRTVFESIESSTIASFFYENNFIIGWIFK